MDDILVKWTVSYCLHTIVTVCVCNEVSTRECNAV